LKRLADQGMLHKSNTALVVSSVTPSELILDAVQMRVVG
jgi:hypothetical protein